MSFYDSSFAPARRPAQGLLRFLFDTPFARRQRALRNRVAALRSLTDDELAALGLRREEIVPYVLMGKRTRGNTD